MSRAVSVVETISELVLEAFRVDAVENGSHSAQRSPENIIQYNTIQFHHKDRLYSLVDSHTLGAMIGKGADRRKLGTTLVLPVRRTSMDRFGLKLDQPLRRR